jgi:homoserine kinase
LLSTVRERCAADRGVYGVTLSGAGPSVLVWCEAGEEGRVAEALDISGASATPLDVAEHGVSVD